MPRKGKAKETVLKKEDHNKEVKSSPGEVGGHCSVLKDRTRESPCGVSPQGLSLGR